MLVVGVGLVVFAAGVGAAARGTRHGRLAGLARLIGVADASWVAATAGLAAAGALSGAGIDVAAVIGVVVAGFAALDLRRATALLAAPPVADTAPPLEAITAGIEVAAPSQRAWAVVTDDELYARLAPTSDGWS